MKIMITGGYDESAADTDEGRLIIRFAKRLARAGCSSEAPAPLWKRKFP